MGKEWSADLDPCSTSLQIRLNKPPSYPLVEVKQTRFAKYPIQEPEDRATLPSDANFGRSRRRQSEHWPSVQGTYRVAVSDDFQLLGSSAASAGMILSNSGD